MAWPLMFWIDATSTACLAEPRPSDIASGIGESMCEASYSLFCTLSRITAQPAVFCSVTLSPSRA